MPLMKILQIAGGVAALFLTGCFSTNWREYERQQARSAGMEVKPDADVKISPQVKK